MNCMCCISKPNGQLTQKCIITNELEFCLKFSNYISVISYTSINNIKQNSKANANVGSRHSTTK